MDDSTSLGAKSSPPPPLLISVLHIARPHLTAESMTVSLMLEVVSNFIITGEGNSYLSRPGV